MLHVIAFQREFGGGQKKINNCCIIIHLTGINSAVQKSFKSPVDVK